MQLVPLQVCSLCEGTICIHLALQTVENLGRMNKRMSWFGVYATCIFSDLGISPNKKKKGIKKHVPDLKSKSVRYFK